jgi:hypothetical protein
VTFLELCLLTTSGKETGRCFRPFFAKPAYFKSAVDLWGSSGGEQSSYWWVRVRWPHGVGVRREGGDVKPKFRIRLQKMAEGERQLRVHQATTSWYLRRCKKFTALLEQQWRLTIPRPHALLWRRIHKIRLLPQGLTLLEPAFFLLESLHW